MSSGFRLQTANVCRALVLGAVLLGTAAPAATAAPTYTPVAPLTDGAHLSANGDVTALTQFGEASATLLVGVGGAVPTPVDAAGTLPRWAYPHVGTDRKGRTVVVYPRCSTAEVTSCDLWMYDVGRQRASRVAGINRASVGETEGVMVRGAVVYARWTAKSAPMQHAGDQTTTLLYKPQGGASRIVTKRGGEQLAFAAGQIAMVRDTDPQSAVCGQPTVELVSTSGARRTVRVYRCGMDSHSPFGLAFVGGRLLWAMHGLDEGHFAKYDLKTRRLAYERVHTEFVYSYAPTAIDGGLVVRNGDLEHFNTWTLDRLTGLTYPRR